MAITSAPTVLDSPPFHTHPFHLQGYVAPQPAATHMVPDVPDIPIQGEVILIKLVPACLESGKVCQERNCSNV